MDSDFVSGARPTGLWRVLRIMGRMAVHRRLNRAYGHWSAVLSRKKRKGSVEQDTKPQRTATARKRPVSRILVGVLAALFLFNSISLSGRVIGVLSDGVIARNGFAVGDAGYDAIQSFVSRWPDTLALPHPTEASSERQQWLNYLQESFRYDLGNSGRCTDDCESRAKEMLQGFNNRGPSAFHHRAEFALIPSADLWPSEARGELIVRLGLILMLISAVLFLNLLGSADRDLGKVEWDLEWLYTFPVHARVLFLARIFEHALGNAFTWFALFPFLFSVLWCAGYRWGSLPLGLMLSAYVAILASSLYVVVETFLRKSVTPGRLKDLQALFLIAHIVLLTGLLSMVFTSPGGFVLDLVERIPLAVAWNPFSAPVLVSVGGREAFGSIAIMAFAALVFPLGAAWTSEWRVRDGLVTVPGTYQGKRGAEALARKTQDWQTTRLTGVFAKELRLLVRDRARFVQAVVVPIVIVGLQLFLFGGISISALGDDRNLAMLAFGTGTFTLMMGAFMILVVEGEALWMLYTFPRELHSVLLQKTVLWCGLSVSYTVLVLVLFSPSEISAAGLANAVTAVVGVLIYSFIASGIGVLATDPLETEQQRKLRVELIYLYMLVVSLYAYAIYSSSAWTKIAQIILCSILAYALWQKVRDHSPYWLDPTQDPPPRISLSDGLVAVLVFFVLQGVLVMGMVSTGSSPGSSLLIGFVVAGSLVVFCTLYAFWRRKVPDLLAQIGLRREEQRQPLLSSIWTGIVGGTIAALVGWTYLQAIRTFEPLRDVWQETFRLSQPDLARSGWLLVLVILAAPIFEEYLFRGLVYRGLRRSTGPLLSVLGSAGIFAIVHPPIAVLPVFVMGCIAALSFEKSSVLLTPVVVHLMYNSLLIIPASL